VRALGVASSLISLNVSGYTTSSILKRLSQLAVSLTMFVRSSTDLGLSKKVPSDELALLDPSVVLSHNVELVQHC